MTARLAVVALISVDDKMRSEDRDRARIFWKHRGNRRLSLKASADHGMVRDWTRDDRQLGVAIAAVQKPQLAPVRGICIFQTTGEWRLKLPRQLGTIQKSSR
jgi:hypothetical protein